jgi:uncharacterized surface protein with fasciclin (FAS1) repeats
MERIKMKRLSFVVTMLALLIASVVPVTAAPAAQEAQNIVEVAVNDGRFETLVTPLTATGLDETLRGDGPFTVFAPTDDAFNALPDGTIEALLDDTDTLSNILLYHVVGGRVMAADVVNLDSAETVLGEPVDISVDGSTVMVNDAQVIITDIEASNGVIHVIDSVLLPPSAEESDSMSEATQQHIVDIASQDGRFEMLVAALTATGLDETLRGDSPFTVFAPTDDAFNALPEGTVEGLLNDIPALTDILLYHVVSGKVMAADVVNLDSAETVLGEPIEINASGNTVMVNDAQVIITDIEASNGVIHVIDSVLLPPAEETGAGGAAGSEMEGEAPSTMPVAGGESSTNLFLVLLLVGGILAVSGLALRWRPSEVKLDR